MRSMSKDFIRLFRKKYGYAKGLDSLISDLVSNCCQEFGKDRFICISCDVYFYCKRVHDKSDFWD